MKFTGLKSLTQQIMIKDLAEGFGKEEDLIFKHEIKLRAFLNCYFTLFAVSTIDLLIKII